ncbi:MAG: anhydro-N-acetylmuramic acid kinase [Propionibacteriaceae bacterium]|jgi:anhydro-N-acetylmuramic acid kinase|nr:hypothetical protein [Propionibacteriaceae bacterium]MDX6323598.1 anhydro-N-acetylmuramic acid kinase [Propionibacteriaceae bacterium]
MRVIGMMSGTSFDAIDAVAADIGVADDAVVIRLLGMISAPYPDDVVADLVAALPPAPVTMAAVCSLDTRIGQAFAAVAADAVDDLAAGAADLIVCHGQTVFHWVEGDAVRGTLQLGQPAWIAERTGLPVVSDLRSRDVAAHGQGAPLVSLLDVWWLRSRPGLPVALNLGGIANLTVGIGTDRPTAFDVGPANALIDAAIREFSGGRQSFDADGAAAHRGQVSPALLADLLADSYYRRPAPKTTGKELFGFDYLRRALAPYPDLHTDDVLATLTELTARTVADAVLAAGATEVIASGGGTRNPTLMARLARAFPGVALRTSDELGLPSGAKEGLAFALLGFLTVHGWPGTVASCTGADHPSVLGSITPGRVPLPPTGSEPPPALLRLE